ncbi:hypothetical protein GUJ93_ZPchr0001g29891 [Zizania palustris]|uniref:Uncharacterized protein n=1 Tax=Zizania palustris TaxID=103762 RepID=A0A8J5VNH6_ZIZPA|nr:hypothetical protein GUJ93_ZPchr0001g29891 [Zizania palustris]
MPSPCTYASRRRARRASPVARQQPSPAVTVPVPGLALDGLDLIYLSFRFARLRRTRAGTYASANAPASSERES